MLDSRIVIPAFPVLRPLFFLRKGNKTKTSDLLKTYAGSDIQFFYFGRSAIWNALKMLDIKHHENILMPSYHCSVEVESAIQAYIKIKFYEIDEHMQADIDDIKAKIDKDTKAIFIIHYFGFSQPVHELKKLCEERGLYLIEDCAHAFMSKNGDKYLGTYGDLGILSIQKFLPVPNGGVLLGKNRNFNKLTKLNPPNRRSVVRVLLIKILSNLEFRHKSIYKIINYCIVHPFKKIFHLLKGKRDLGIISPTSVNFNLKMANLAMSKISRKILDDIDLNKMVAIRRANYDFLFQALQDVPEIKIFFPHLSEGTCPCFMPIQVEGSRKIHTKLLEKGVSTFIFGEFLHKTLPEKGFDTARYFSKNILALPIHQDLEERHLTYMVDAIKNVLRDC